MDQEHQHLIEVLPYVRIILGESGETFAHKLGVSRLTYIKIENGNMTTLYYHAINNLIRELSVNDAECWCYIIPLMLFPKEEKVSKFIKKCIDNASKHHSNKLGVKRLQKSVLAALNKHREKIADMAYGKEN